MSASVTKKRARPNDNAAATGDASAASLKYRRGAIRRVKLQNFMTYSTVEVQPGPSLNVVCGFNGSGKSSLIIAIGLGLGGSPSSMGRADKIQDYVKRGEEWAKIEIELHEALNGRHVTVSRQIWLNGESAWRVDGKKVGKKDFRNLLDDLTIQIDNRCVFLAQDKVGEFAQLDPVNLLKVTEKACNPRLLELHTNLSEWKKQERMVDGQCKEQEEDLRTLEQRLEGLKADVEQIHQRQTIKTEKELLLKKRPWVLFGAEKDKCVELKAVVEQVTAAVKEEQKKRVPLAKRVAQAEEQLKIDQKKCSEADAQFEKLDSSRRQFSDSLDAMDKNVMDNKLKLDNLVSEGKEREGTLQKLEDDLQRATAALAEIPEDTAVEEQVRELQRENQRHTDALDDAQDMLRQMGQENRTIERELTGLQQKADQLRNVNAQRLQRACQLRGQHQLVEIYEWVQAQKRAGKFQGLVFGPIFLELTVKDPLHMKFLERAVQKKFSYMVQTKTDWDYLIDNFKRKGWTESVIQMPSNTAINPKRNLPNLKRRGLSGYLDDLVECDPALKPALIKFFNLDQMGYMMTESKENVLDLLPQTPQDRADYPMVVFTPSYEWNVKFSRYGQQDRSAHSQTLPNPSGLFHSVDSRDLEAVESDMQALAQRRQELGQRVQKATQAKFELQETVKGLLDKIRELNRSKNRRKQQQRAVEVVKQHIQKEQQGAKTLSSRMEKVQKELRDLNTARFKKAQALAKVVESWSECALKRAGLILNKTERHAVLEHAKAQLDALSDDYHRLEKQLKQASAEYEQQKRVAQEQKKVAKREAALGEVAPAKFKLTDPEVIKERGDGPITYKDLFRQSNMPDELEELDLRVSELTAQADAVVTNDQALAQYQELQDQIKELKVDTSKGEKHQKLIKDKIQEALGEWLPTLEQIVGSINESFTKYFADINCKGEVRLGKAGDDQEDYDQYRLEIWVSFRHNAPMKLLTSHSQSGGERSVSTMLFLLCLQKSVTNCPFRVVDEINQGMDAPNERMIFKQISNSSNTNDTPQYFLVTPKLLPGLVYGDNITMIFVYNGPWNVSQSQWDLKKFVELGRAQKRIRAH